MHACRASRVRRLGLVGLLALGCAAAHADGPSFRGALRDVFVAATDLGQGWDTVREEPIDTSQEASLASVGVHTMHTRHYTRARPGGSQVCSVEIWGFASPDQARAATAHLDNPGWRITRRGNLLVMLRGVTLQHGEGFQKGMEPECHRLADLTEARAADLLR